MRRPDVRRRVAAALRPTALGVLLACAPVATTAGSSCAADTVRIGLVLSGEAPSARQAALLAVDEANADSPGDRAYRLVVRVNDGPWGSGATKIAELVFDDHVAALVGSLDGRGAHLAEQIVTKARLPYVESWATESTVTQAYVPWVFRCVPDDRRQAQALARELFERRGLGLVLLVSDDSYDTRNAMEAFVRVAGEYPGVRLSRRDHVQDEGPPAEATVLFAYPATHPPKPFPGTLVLGSVRLAGALPDRDVLAVGASLTSLSEGRRFLKNYTARWSAAPDARAAYAYDAVTLVIRTIEQAGADPHALRKTLAGNELDGVTGRIRFDELGNRRSLPTVVERPGRGSG